MTKASLFAGVEQMRPGNHLGDVSAAIQRSVEAEGLSVIRTLVGHGIGREMHEEPQVPNFGEPGKGPELEEGMVLAIEPMVNAGGPLVRMGDDGWSVFSEDDSLAAHFEFTVAVTPDGPAHPHPLARGRASQAPAGGAVCSRRGLGMPRAAGGAATARKEVFAIVVRSRVLFSLALVLLPRAGAVAPPRSPRRRSPTAPTTPAASATCCRRARTASTTLPAAASNSAASEIAAAALRRPAAALRKPRSTARRR